MNPLYYQVRRIQAAGAALGVPTATVTHTRNGTFTVNFIGPNGAQILCTPSNGSPQLITLLGPGINVPFSYASDGSLQNVIFKGAGLGVATTFSGPIQSVASVSNLQGMTSLEQFSFFYNDITSADIRLNSPALTYINLSTNQIVDPAPLAALYGMSLFYVNDNPMVYPPGGLTWFAATSGTYRFYSTVTTSGEVDQWLIDLAAAGWSNCTVYLDGTNPARTSASDAAVATLVGNSVTLFLN